MKQTNNAIKFLMAQYRAIFQNAYFKGLAAAAIVTMGLAAGQAQAADITAIGDLATAGNATISGTSAVDLTTAAGENKWLADLVISNGKNGQAHTLKAGTDGDSVVGTGSLTLSSSDDSKLTIGAAEAKGLSVSLNAITISQGELGITAGNVESKNTTVTAKNITLGGGEKTAKVTLTAATAKGLAVLGNAADSAKNIAASTTTLNKNGTISFAGTNNASDAVLKGKLAGNGGKLDFSTTKGQVEAYGTVEKLDINVGAGGEGVISLTNVDGTEADESVLTINSGTISIVGADGKLSVAKGTLDLGESVRATVGTADKGTIDVSAGVLKLSKDQLVSFLSADGDTTDNKGKLTIGATGEVFLKSSNPVRSSGLEFAADEAGKISTTAGATIAADNLNISTAVKGVTGLVLKAEDTLVAGSDSFESSKGKLGATLKAKKLTLKAKEDVFTLQDGAVLSSYQKTKKDDKDILSATSGVLNSNAINISGGSVEVAAGNYEFGENITISEGQLKVTSAVDNLNSGVVASSLKLANGNISIANATGNGITVSGSQAQLDISEAGSLSVTKAKSEADIQILLENKGELSLKGEQVLSFIKPTTSGLTKKSSFALKGDAKLHVVDDLTLDQNQLSSATVNSTASQTGDAVIFDDQATAGTLVVDGTLTVNKATTAVTVGEHGAIEAGNLVLNPTASNDTTELGKGSFTVLTGLESANGVKLSSANSVLKLGKIVPVEGSDPEYATSVGGGNITAALDNSSGSVNILAGSWTAAKTVTVGADSTAFAIGSAGGEVDDEGNKITANLTVSDKLTVAKASGLTVNSVGTLTANAVDVTGSVAVSGNMVLNGKWDDNQKSGDSTDDLFGVKLAAGAIVLNKDSKLTIQGDAIKGIQTDADGKVKFASDFDTNVKDGAIDSNPGSSLHLDFAEGKLSAEGLETLNTKLFGASGPDGLVYLGNAEIVGLTPTNGQVSWSDAAKKYEDYLPTYTNEALMGAKLTNVESTDNVTGHFGSVVTDKITQAGADVQFTKKAGLYTATTIKGDDSGKKYFALGKDNVVLGAKVLDNSELTLANGGISTM